MKCSSSCKCKSCSGKSKSARYYAANPDSREKKKAYDTKYHATPERIKHAVEDAGLTEAVESFPDGLDTLLGERGVTLSGGQRQRTALARAILTEPKLLLIDDGLSAVDADTEERILRSLTVRLAGKTAVIVSHRVSAVADLDHVIVLDGGRVVESGAPRDLLARGGSLAALARLQRDAEALAGGKSA